MKLCILKISKFHWGRSWGSFKRVNNVKLILDWIGLNEVSLERSTYGLQKRPRTHALKVKGNGAREGNSNFFEKIINIWEFFSPLL